MLSTIANLFNSISDLDLTWIGFRSFKPAPHEKMRFSIVLRMLMFHAPGSAVYTALFVLLSRGESVRPAFAWSAGFFAATLLCMMHTLAAYFWNQRAEQLQRMRAAWHQ